MHLEPVADEVRPSLGGEEGKPSKRDRRIEPWTWLVIGVTALVWGIGLNVDRFFDTEYPWASLATLPGLAAIIYFARRLGPWLLLFIPASLMLITVLSLLAENATVAPVSWLREQTKDEVAGCEGWENPSTALGPIANGIIAFNQDVQLAVSETAVDEQRWSQQAGNIRRQYEALEHPAALDTYVQLSITTFTNYEQGFAALSRGDYATGNAFLDAGDALLTQARTAFNEANLRCG